MTATLIGIFRYLARKSSVATADKFLVQVRTTLDRLAGHPGLGTRYDPDELAFANLRYCPVDRYRHYLVFYKPTANGIEVYRVLHGARDLAGLLGEELDLDEDEAPPP